MHFHIPYHGYVLKQPTKMLALYHALRDTIVDGVLLYGTKLPSSREMAGLYGISRGTVNQVYDMLASEGYLVCEVGRGTFISFRGEEPKERDTGKKKYKLSEWGQRVSEQPRPEVMQRSTWNDADSIADFHTFKPDYDAFPQEEWNRCLHAEARKMLEDKGGEPASSQGDPELRESIAQYLRRARGIAVGKDQVVIVNGSMQAIALTVQLLIQAGDRVIMENPGFKGIVSAVNAVNGTMQPVKVDEQGIVPGHWEAKLLFVTPSRQFPTGAVLSLDRRQQLLQWANDKEAIIVEDDYDSEFRHRGKALEPLKVLDREERVVYIGSFTKTLLPSIRIGYAVLPSSLIHPFVKAKSLYEPLPTGLLEQKTLAAFMQSGQYERHLRRMKRVYSRKFEYLLKRLHEHLSAQFDWVESDAGLHIFGWWRGTAAQYVTFRDRCSTAGIRWSETLVKDAERNRYGAYFHFPHVTQEAMELGVKIMKEIAEESAPILEGNV
ncbi:MocR-like pyridoxine biosynthesis transcription factor PdxR [Paenibacillus sp. UNC451MF]|uniref:MocR-like pyridoxine biosynthesis transcription factor PdxR n=1 Tax=Paenibacillus sp. UNC451MF TaxID=1449063 RepID=UPI0004916C23|nr:PLP-dependent aminotransferase family protein [Paenibacillus sp. UNC451MF]